MKKIPLYFIYVIILTFSILPIIFISIILLITQGTPIIFWSERVGKNKKLFKMPKFRSMKNNVPMIATHLLEQPESKITIIGKVLRKYSLDELPQVISLFQGNMSIVGPRPALFNQYDLIKLREEKNIHTILPGITGLAQINGRDNISLEEKVGYDYVYLVNKSFFYDLKIIFLTIFRIIKSRDISH
jgi:O-antigen biosynthesis protein WbqP